MQALEEDGKGRVLVVDIYGSLSCAPHQLELKFTQNIIYIYSSGDREMQALNSTTENTLYMETLSIVEFRP